MVPDTRVAVKGTIRVILCIRIESIGIMVQCRTP